MSKGITYTTILEFTAKAQCIYIHLNDIITASFSISLTGVSQMLSIMVKEKEFTVRCKFIYIINKHQKSPPCYYYGSIPY